MCPHAVLSMYRGMSVAKLTHEENGVATPLLGSPVQTNIAERWCSHNIRWCRSVEILSSRERGGLLEL